MKTFPANCSFNVTTEVCCTSIDEDTVILDLKSGTYFGLNSIGTRIWNLLQESKTVSEIRNLLLEEYEVEIAECESTLQQLLQKLVKAELIEMKIEETT